MTSNSLNKIKLAEGESTIKTYHVIEVIIIPPFLKRIANFIRGRKPKTMANGYMILTNRRLIYFHEEKPPDALQDEVNFILRDIYLHDINMVSAGHQKYRGNDIFEFSVDTIGKRIIEMESGFEITEEIQSQPVRQRILAPFAYLFDFLKQWAQERIRFNATSDSVNFCREIGARVAEFQSI